VRQRRSRQGQHRKYWRRCTPRSTVAAPAPAVPLTSRGTNHYHVHAVARAGPSCTSPKRHCCSLRYMSNWATLSTLAARWPAASCCPTKLNHASMIEGIRHSRAAKMTFAHNDPPTSTAARRARPPCQAGRVRIGLSIGRRHSAHRRNVLGIAEGARGDDVFPTRCTRSGSKGRSAAAFGARRVAHRLNGIEGPLVRSLRRGRRLYRPARQPVRFCAQGFASPSSSRGIAAGWGRQPPWPHPAPWKKDAPPNAASCTTCQPAALAG